MAVYLITYDLRKPGRNYDTLYKLLRTTWKCARLAESVWLGHLTGPAEAIRNFVKGTVDANDRIVVIEIKAGADWAARHAIPGGLAILKQASP